MMKKTATMLIMAFALGVAMGIIGSYMLVAQPESPYLKHSQRLGDVLAAIQVMGTYQSDNNSPDEWEKAIGTIREGAWSDVFMQHPEFFRTDKDNKVSLVWRRARDWRWDKQTRNKITQDEFDSWSQEQRDNRLAREPLTPEQSAKLMEIAINIQTQAIARRAELRWWVPMLAGLAGVLLGAFLKSRT